MINIIEDENEDTNLILSDFKIDLDNSDNSQEDAQDEADQNLKKEIGEILKSINEYSECLINEILRVWKLLGFSKNSEGFILLKKVILDIYNYSKINFNKRLIDFFRFLNCEYILRCEDICQAINSINENITKVKTNDDIIFLWKKEIIELVIFNKENKNQIKIKELEILLKEKYNINEIYKIIQIFKIIYTNDNFQQIDILHSLIYLKKIIEDNYNPHKNELDSKVILEFYLEAIKMSKNEPIELNIPELLQQLEKLNPKLSKPIFTQLEKQLMIVNLTRQNHNYQNFKKKDFQEWTYKDFPNLKFNEENFNESISKLIGMISLAIRCERGYYLRNSQILSILLFIEKEKKYGLIEEISPGEGKSIIICSLGIYFGLRKKKVDIFCENLNLAIRDSFEYTAIYAYFNLTTSYPYNSNTEPYKCNILYSSFLEFKMDIFREIIFQKKIRNNRPFEVIILDDVDYLLLDNILSVARLSNSTKGFIFPISFDLSIYFSFELYDYLFLLILLNLIQIDPCPWKRRNYENLIKEPKNRKKIIIEIMKSLLGLQKSEKINEIFGYYKDLFPEKIVMEEINKNIFKTLSNLKYIKEILETLLKSFNLENIDKIYEKFIEIPDFRKEIIGNILKELKKQKNIEIINEKLKSIFHEKISLEEVKKILEILYSCEGSLKDFLLSLQCPEFLESFGISQIFNLINNDFEFKNIIKDFKFLNDRINKEHINQIFTENLGEALLSNILNIGQNQILEIKKKLKINNEILTNIFLSNISVFQKYQNDKEFLFFGLTETIGDKETQKIYQEPYFNSKILFIPEYRKKRFIELPPKFSNNFTHYDDICEDIIINFYYGRKIFVICDSIKETYELKKYLDRYNLNDLKEKNKNFKNIDNHYKDKIILFNGYNSEDYYKLKNGKIILSPCYALRGLDIMTTKEEEFNGGLHIILTYMPSNYRLLKQAFGRTAHFGKNGTGQIIIESGEYNYSQLFEKMIDNEKKILHEAEKQMKVLYFKDKLFFDFCEAVKIIDFNPFKNKLKKYYNL